MRAKAITVTLGGLRSKVEQRVKSGAYSSASEVVREGLRALDRQEAMLDDILRQRVQAAYDNPGPWIPIEEIFDSIEREHAVRTKAAKRGA